MQLYFTVNSLQVKQKRSFFLGVVGCIHVNRNCNHKQFNTVSANCEHQTFTVCVFDYLVAVLYVKRFVCLWLMDFKRIQCWMYFLIMMLRLLLMIIAFSHNAIYTSANYEGAKTLYGNKEITSGKTLFLNADSESFTGEHHQRIRRDVPQPVLTNSTVKMKVCILWKIVVYELFWQCKKGQNAWNAARSFVCQ